MPLPSTDPARDPSAPPVELRVRADPTQLAIVRGVAATVAGQLDFGVDSIADLRLAVDEACSHLIVRGGGASDLVCTFTPTDNGVVVTATASTTTVEPTVRKSFGWHVLNTLTDSVGIDQSDDPERPGAFLTTIEFVKVKDGHTA